MEIDIESDVVIADVEYVVVLVIIITIDIIRFYVYQFPMKIYKYQLFSDCLMVIIAVNGNGYCGWNWFVWRYE